MKGCREKNTWRRGPSAVSSPTLVFLLLVAALGMLLPAQGKQRDRTYVFSSSGSSSPRSCMPCRCAHSMRRGARTMTLSSVACRELRCRRSRTQRGAGATSEPASEAEVPIATSTVTWGFLLLFAACVAVRDEVIFKNVTFEQGALACAIAAASAWRAREDVSWAALSLRAFAGLGIFGFFVERVLGVPIVDIPGAQRFAPFLAVVSAVGLAAQTLINKDENENWTFAGVVPLPPPPISSRIPYWQLGVAALAFLSQDPNTRGALGLSLTQSQDIANALGLTIGRVGGWALVGATVCAVVTPAALYVWSRQYVKGNHGPVQNMLGPMLAATPALIIPFAVVNAIAEEVEFRMLLQGSLLAGPAAGSYPWVAVTVLLQAAYFAVLHYRVGLPSGRVGFFMVLVWAGFLGFLRWWAGGVGLVLLLHTEADIVIFALVLLEERMKAEAAAAAQRKAKPVPFSSFFLESDACCVFVPHASDAIFMAMLRMTRLWKMSTRWVRFVDLITNALGTFSQELRWARCRAVLAMNRLASTARGEGRASNCPVAEDRGQIVSECDIRS
eukprot:CAMPEP_0117520564 /NCGR_PEP_ID=MMETSP0784-20121206/33231_1 /TAXON_ID=39447 /ORGANISM="" /LENGTH=557 /DNA_ID=CAMNT_0005316557 /DNA_START=159 /DNA_END=1829 /DNA_ORIENTATION=+